MTAICFTVPGKPQGKARARTYYNAKKKAMSSTTPDKTVLYENFIAMENAGMISGQKQTRTIKHSRINRRVLAGVTGIN